MRPLMQGNLNEVEVSVQLTSLCFVLTILGHLLLVMRTIFIPYWGGQLYWAFPSVSVPGSRWRLARSVY